MSWLLLLLALNAHADLWNVDDFSSQPPARSVVANTQIGVAAGTDLLIQGSFALQKTPDDASPDGYIGTEDLMLIWAHLDASVGSKTLDIRFTPIAGKLRLEDGKVTLVDSDGNLDEIGVQLTPVRLSRDTTLGESFGVQIAVVGAKGQFERVFSDRIKLFAKVALDLLGFQRTEFTAGAAPFSGMHVAQASAEAGAKLATGQSMVVRLSLAGEGDLGYGWATDFQSSHKVSARLMAQIHELTQIYLQTGYKGIWDNADSLYRSSSETLVGVRFLF